MKRKTIFFVMILSVTLLFTQSCKKEAPYTIMSHNAFTDPVAVSPANEAVVHTDATTLDLTWESTNADGAPVKADVYFGTSPNPPLYQEGATSLSLNVPVVKGGTYYWSVTMIDANGIITIGQTWSFTIFEPIGIFVGDYTVDEPAEGWTYDVTLSKQSDNELAIDAYWASWPAVFTLDFTANTYTLPLIDFGGGYSGEESGTIDPATGTLVGNYIIYHNGANIEEGVHTYTKN